MAKLFGLTARQQKRVGRVVRERETSGPARANKSTGDPKDTPQIYAELTGESGTDAGHYSWKMKFPKGPPDGTFIDADPAYVVAEFTARELNLRAGLTAGTIVKLTFIGYDAAGKGSYEFNAGAESCSTDSPETLGDGSEGTQAGDTTTEWPSDPENVMPLDLWVVTNVGYFEAPGDETLYAYKRKVRINSCGKIYAVTPETRVSVDVPTLCNPA